MKNRARTTQKPALRKPTVAFVVGAVAASTLFGGGAAWAYWTAEANASGTVKAAKLQVATSGFSNINKTFQNHDLNSTVKFTVSNSGDVAGAVQLNIKADGNALAANLPLAVWKQNDGVCDASTQQPDTATKGLWSSIVVPAGTLAAGETATYCARTVVPSTDRDKIASQTGALAASPTLNASVSNGSWSANASPQVASLHTLAIYPKSSAYLPGGVTPRWFAILVSTHQNNGNPTKGCLDVANSGQAENSRVISYNCESNGNQLWQATPVNGNNTLIQLRPRHAPTLRLGLNAAGTAVVLRSANTSDLSTNWFVQQRAEGKYQLVNEKSGLCLVTGTLGSDATVVKCDQAPTFDSEHRPLKVVNNNGVLSFTTGNGVTPMAFNYSVAIGAGVYATQPVTLPGNGVFQIDTRNWPTNSSNRLRVNFTNGEPAFPIVRIEKAANGNVTVLIDNASNPD